MATETLQYLDPDGLDETAVHIARIKGELEAAMQDLPYARPDGIYPDMTVGAVIGADETAQWAERESAASGTARVESVQGAAVGWNQMLPAVTESDWVVSAATKNVVGNVAEVTPSSQYGRITYRGIEIIASHVYLCELDFKIISDGSFIVYTSTNMPFTYLLGNVVGSDQWRHSAQILTATANNAGTNLIINIQDNRASGWDTWSIRNVMLFDLTAMFGSGNEPTTVAEFEQMFPAAYYPYSAPTLKPVQIAGIQSTDANGNALDGVEWAAQTLRAAGSVRDELTAGELLTRVGVVDLGTLTWVMVTSGEAPYFNATISNLVHSNRQDNFSCARYGKASIGSTGTASGICTTDAPSIRIRDTTYSSAAEFKTAMSGVLLYYELATPTTTPISPALPMTYKVQQGGAESIIVPEGEISAAPVLTVAEPVNAGDEFARIWAAIEQLQNRGSAQLTRTDIGSIDETKKDTAEIAEIGTIKEVQE